MNLETKITIYKFTPQVFTLTPNSVAFLGLLKMQLNINRKTSCNAFPNRLVSILHLLIQE